MLFPEEKPTMRSCCPTRLSVRGPHYMIFISFSIPKFSVGQGQEQKHQVMFIASAKGHFYFILFFSVEDPKHAQEL